MTCRGVFSDGSEQAERTEASATIANAAVTAADADLRTTHGFETSRWRRTGKRFIRGRLLTGERSYYERGREQPIRLRRPARSSNAPRHILEGRSPVVRSKITGQSKAERQQFECSAPALQAQITAGTKGGSLQLKRRGPCGNESAISAVVRVLSWKASTRGRSGEAKLEKRRVTGLASSKTGRSENWKIGNLETGKGGRSRGDGALS